MIDRARSVFSESEFLFLDPRVEPPLAFLLDRTRLLSDLVDALGSPLNVVLPEQLETNLAAFRGVYAAHRLRGAIYLASKASRSTALLRRLAATDAQVEVASLGELRHALAAGFTGDRLLAGGPKTTPYLWLAARSGASVHLDSAEELRTLAGLVHHFQLPPVPVLVRLCDFGRDRAGILSRTSRFGVPITELDPVLDLLVAEQSALRMVGVGFHLDTSSLAEKANAVERCVLALDAANHRGLRPRRIDVGGGFGVRYLADPDQWRRYTSALTEAVLGQSEPMTWQGHSYGLRAESGTVRGALQLYPAARQDAGAAYLDALLDTRGPALGRPLGTMLLEHLYDLDIEPGRALLDQCGLTLVRVAEIGRRAGRLTLRVDANRDDVSLEAGGVLVDPIVIPRRPDQPDQPDQPKKPDQSDVPCQAYLLGNRCLEHDLITHRLVSLRRTPRVGDLLALVNTAGYFADFNVTGALRQPIASRIVITSTARSPGPATAVPPVPVPATASATSGDDCWHWCDEEQYWPTVGVNL